MPLRTAHVKVTRWLLVGVIAVVLVFVLFNYLQILNKRRRTAGKNPQILSSATLRLAEGVEYSEYREGVLRFRIHALKLLEVRMGRSFLEGIEAYDFNPDGSIHNQIRSRKAVYDREQKIVDFSGDVQLFLEEDIELRTNSLHYDLNANVGATPDPLQLHSRQVRGMARGAHFDQKQGALNLGSDVDFVLVRKRPKAGGPEEMEKLHATSDRASCTEMMHRIIFQGQARIESDTGILSGDTIELALSPDRRRVTALTAAGNTTYQSKEMDETRSLHGDAMVFVIGASGGLEKIRVTGQAAFSLNSPAGDQDLRGGLIEMEIDPAGSALTRILSRSEVLFRMTRGSEKTQISGDELDARVIPETKSLESVLVRKGAKLSTEGSGDSTRNELQADQIRIGFREINGRAVYEKLRGEGSAKWMSTPRDAVVNREAVRTMAASLLEMMYSPEGDFWESGSASGNVVITEDHAGQSGNPQMRRFQADSAQFHFFPLNGRPRDINAQGYVQISYEKRSRSNSETIVEKFETQSDRMKAVFTLRNEDSVIESVSQWGSFRYRDNAWSATAGRCDYDARNGSMLLKESPKISGFMGVTTGEVVEYDQRQKVLSVRRSVRSVLRAQKDEGSFFGSAASSSPSIVIADEMKYWRETGSSRYIGRVQWLSESQQLQCQILDILDSGERIEAQGNVHHLISGEARESTTQSRKSSGTRNSASAPISIQSSSLRYTKDSNTLAYSGNVALNSGDLKLSALGLNAILDKEGKNVERASAYGKILISSGNTECSGETADWYLDPGKYVVTGEPVEVRDPVRGRSLARRLTSFTADDTILLESR